MYILQHKNSTFNNYSYRYNCSLCEWIDIYYTYTYIYIVYTCIHTHIYSEFMNFLCRFNNSSAYIHIIHMYVHAHIYEVCIDIYVYAYVYVCTHKHTFSSPKK